MSRPKKRDKSRAAKKSPRQESAEAPLLTQGELGDAKADREYGSDGSRASAGGGQPPFGTRHWGQGEFKGKFSGVGPKGYKRTDERMLEDINEALYHHHEIDASDVEVSVKAGVVSLTGSVDSRPTKRMVESVVDMVSGVVDVHNQLKLRDRQG